MDHEVAPGRFKSVDWLLNSSQDNFGFHWRKNGGGTMEVEVPKIQFLKPNKCTDMVQRVFALSGKRGGPEGNGKGPWQRSGVLMVF